MNESIWTCLDHLLLIKILYVSDIKREIRWNKIVGWVENFNNYFKLIDIVIMFRKITLFIDNAYNIINIIIYVFTTAIYAYVIKLMSNELV